MAGLQTVRTDAARERNKREGFRREVRSIASTLLHMLGYTALVCGGLLVYGFVAFMVFS